MGFLRRPKPIYILFLVIEISPTLPGGATQGCLALNSLFIITFIIFKFEMRAKNNECVTRARYMTIVTLSWKQRKIRIGRCHWKEYLGGGKTSGYGPRGREGDGRRIRNKKWALVAFDRVAEYQRQCVQDDAYSPRRLTYYRAQSRHHGPTC